MEVVKKYGISEKRLKAAIECIKRLADTYTTEVEKIEVIDKYLIDNCSTWQILYTFSNGKFKTLLINKKAIF